MNLLKATQTKKIASNRRVDLKSAIGQMEQEKLFFGAVFQKEDSTVVFGSEENAKLYAPALLNNITMPTAIVVVIKSDTAYFFAKIDGQFCDEFEFLLDSTDDAMDVQRLTAFCSIYRKDLADASWYTNVDVTSTGQSSVNLDGKIELPLDPAQQKSFSDIRHIKPVLAVDLNKELGRARKKAHPLAVLALIALSVGITYYVNFYSNSKPEETNIASKKPKNTSKYEGLKNYYTKVSVEPKEILRDVFRQMNAAKLLRGWQLQEIKVAHTEKGLITQYFVLESIYGEVSELAKFAQERQFEMNVSGRIAYLARNIKPASVYSDFARFHVGTWHNWLSKGVGEFWDDVDYAITRKENVGNEHWFISKGEITYPVLYPDDLESIGSLMQGFPYSFDYLEMKLKNRHENSWGATLRIEIAGVENNA